MPEESSPGTDEKWRIVRDRDMDVALRPIPFEGLYFCLL